MMDNRFTRCPHCSTYFLISDNELQKAFGVARCGCCKKIFNASNHLLQLPDASSVQESAETAQEYPSSEAEAPWSDEYRTTETEVFAEHNTLQTEQPNIRFADPYEHFESTESSSYSSKRTDNRAPHERPEAASGISLSAAREDKTEAIQSDFSVRAEPQSKSKQTVNAYLKALPIPQLPWRPLALVSVLLLVFLLILWSNTRSLSQSPGFAGVAEAICTFSPCSHPLPSDFATLQVSQQVIIESSLPPVAELVLNNPQPEAVPFPAILLELRDAHDNIVGEQFFQPGDYLKGKPFADQILPPDLPIPLNFPLLTEQPENLKEFSVRFYPAR